jgi:hypothetical protein
MPISPAPQLDYDEEEHGEDPRRVISNARRHPRHVVIIGYLTALGTAMAGLAALLALVLR